MSNISHQRREFVWEANKCALRCKWHKPERIVVASAHFANIETKELNTTGRLCYSLTICSQWLKSSTAFLCSCHRPQSIHHASGGTFVERTEKHLSLVTSEVALCPLLPQYCVKLPWNIWFRDYQYVFYLEKVIFHLGNFYFNLISPSI